MCTACVQRVSKCSLPRLLWLGVPFCSSLRCICITRNGLNLLVSISVHKFGLNALFIDEKDFTKCKSRNPPNALKSNFLTKSSNTFKNKCNFWHRKCFQKFLPLKDGKKLLPTHTSTSL
ncbi:hypothetical protein EGR_10392 [Echinococcus granulosus]|uniref:Uncharacterized protein n=1 Tax=Echinococcus granulosus TaxID=6210 RepID=W6U8H0_ECHGR|nr:hypothetical protein EGR_10392 [Echinococcus granulosus]EUB54752.1 hypothetical protein EGR_10392 [Echinococcus granulosus]